MPVPDTAIVLEPTTPVKPKSSCREAVTVMVVGWDPAAVGANWMLSTHVPAGGTSSAGFPCPQAFASATEPGVTRYFAFSGNEGWKYSGIGEVFFTVTVSDFVAPTVTLPKASEVGVNV